MAEIVVQQTPAPRAAVQRMQAYHPPLGGRQGLRLDFNENTVACSPRVLEALARIAAADLAKYPERGQVEAKVAQHLSLEPATVLLTNGVDEAIHVLCQTYLDREDEFLFPTPTYSMYEVYGSCTDATVKTVPSGEDFAFPLERLLAAITPKTRLIAIASPNSPTGTVATREQILEVLHRAPHAAVLVDEAYYHFCGETVIDLVGQGAEPDRGAHVFQSLWTRRAAAGDAGRPGGYSTVAANGHFPLQRELAGAGLPAGGTG